MPILARIAYGPATVTGTQVSGPVFIELRDAATGQLVNGNNVTVAYDMNINGTVTENSVSIAGQSQLIYYGELSDSDPFFFTKFQAGTVSAAPDPDPPVNRCDLVLELYFSRQARIITGLARCASDTYRHIRLPPNSIQ